MKPLNSIICEEDWLLTMKKEIIEDIKEKESKYNFGFDEEKNKEGKFLWTIHEQCSILQ